MPQKKLKKLESLEKSWDSGIKSFREPKRHIQMSKDIKSFILKSIALDSTNSNTSSADNFNNENTIKSRKAVTQDMYNSITSTFNFRHHEGTDRSLELKVIKIILVREGLIMNLKYLSDRSQSTRNIDSTCTSILEVLAQIRESTLNYLEALCLWRQSIPDAAVMSPRVFFWEGKNYTLKIINDIDFLSDNELIVTSLNISAEQFKSNPLMLTNNLEDPSTWMDPVERAAEDADGQKEGIVFESRLRLRFAERILLQEIELTSAPEIDIDYTTQQPEEYIIPDQNPPKSQSNHQNFQDTTSEGLGNKPLMRGSSALESDFDDGDERYEEDFDGSSRKAWDASQQPNILPPLGSHSNGGSSSERIGSADSGRSDGTLPGSLPVSRSSTLTGGMNSAPSSAYGNRMSASSRGGVSSRRSNRAGSSGMGVAMKENGDDNNVQNPPYYDVGHDFFTGNWAESTVEDGSRAVPAQLEGGDFPFYSEASNAAEQEITMIDGDNREDSGINRDIFYIDDGNPVPATSGQIKDNQTLNQGSEDASQMSFKSPETVSTIDLHILVNISKPPRSLVIAAAAAIIILTPGKKVPEDRSWSAFVQMSNRVNVAELIENCRPLNIPKFKIILVKPILEQLGQDHSYFQQMQKNELPFQEFCAINKFVLWVQQFTTEAIIKQQMKEEQQGKGGKKKRSGSPSKTPLDSSASPTSAGDSSGFKSKQGKGKISLQPLAATQRQSKFSPNDGNTEMTSPEMDADELESLPVNRNSIPKINMELFPVHSELVSDMYKNPLLVAVLTSDESKANLSPEAAQERMKNKKNSPTPAPLSEKSPSPPGSSAGTDRRYSNPQVPPPRKASITRPLPHDRADDHRVVLKVYDVVESYETYLTVNMREYTLLLKELDARHNDMASQHYKPEEPAWWAAHIKEVLQISTRAHGKMFVNVSKKAIEAIVVNAIRKKESKIIHALDSPKAKRKSKSSFDANNKATVSNKTKTSVVAAGSEKKNKKSSPSRRSGSSGGSIGNGRQNVASKAKVTAGSSGKEKGNQRSASPPTGKKTGTAGGSKRNIGKSQPQQSVAQPPPPKRTESSDGVAQQKPEQQQAPQETEFQDPALVERKQEISDRIVEKEPDSYKQAQAIEPNQSDAKVASNLEETTVKPKIAPAPSAHLSVLEAAPGPADGGAGKAAATAASFANAAAPSLVVTEGVPPTPDHPAQQSPVASESHMTGKAQTNLKHLSINPTASPVAGARGPVTGPGTAGTNEYADEDFEEYDKTPVAQYMGDMLDRNDEKQNESHPDSEQHSVGSSVMSMNAITRGNTERFVESSYDADFEEQDSTDVVPKHNDSSKQQQGIAMVLSSSGKAPDNEAEVTQEDSRVSYGDDFDNPSSSTVEPTGVSLVEDSDSKEQQRIAEAQKELNEVGEEDIAYFSSVDESELQ